MGQREGLLSFEKNLERKEGVASYVEQRARAEIFDVQPETVQSHFGYSRQYVVGAAIGRLLDEAVGSDRWQEMVESGKTLSACVAAFSEDRQTDLDELRLLEMEDAEKIKVSQILRQANQKVDELLENEAITLKLPNQKYVARSFNPSAVVSLGDGRLIHSNGVGIYLPNGKIEVRDGAVLEDYSRGIVVIPGCSYDFSNSELGAREQHVWLDLKNAKKRNENSFELI